ncbi:MAG: FtsX-like permease family protein, partial [Acidobacteria bacterium]|nr:FtsX-like permease family protein [Acidobacteriota bacterium]
QQAVWSINPNLPLADVRMLDEILERSMAQTSFTLVMLAIAAGVALLLGVVGIYGVISYSASQRRREIGIRMALGAQRAEVSGLFVRHALLLTAIGLALGLGAAVGLTRLMSALLFGVDALDPLTFGGVAVLLGAAVLLASYLPARRASGLDPVDALRRE